MSRRRKRDKKYTNNQATDVLEAQTPNQARLIEAIDTAEQVIVTGPAGTGKTYITASKAASFLLNVPRSRVVLTRPNVGAGGTIGFLPGELEDKMAPWCAPVLEVFKERLGASHLEALMSSKRIEIVPLEYIRGRSFDDTFIICDEAQNATIDQLKALVTRHGRNSTTIINGDVRQTDLGVNSGLARLQRIARINNLPIPTIEFEVDDIVRSGIVKDWVIAFLDDEQCSLQSTKSPHYGTLPKTNCSEPSPVHTPESSEQTQSSCSVSTNYEMFSDDL